MADRQNFAPAMRAFGNIVSPCSLIPVIVTAVQPVHAVAVNGLLHAERRFPAPVHLGALDSCDKHMNESAYVVRPTSTEAVHG
jgi:hypothetical protein